MPIPRALNKLKSFLQGIRDAVVPSAKRPSPREFNPQPIEVIITHPLPDIVIETLDLPVIENLEDVIDMSSFDNPPTPPNAHCFKLGDILGSRHSEPIPWCTVDNKTTTPRRYATQIHETKSSLLRCVSTTVISKPWLVHNAYIKSKHEFYYCYYTPIT